ncbi:hypothetical protein CFOL_v3_22870 [Cephalotus follicularis]|uniref:Zf-RVT domain-containing protein n=1 Tax=Cephalotus follicularis TaxID=3775 RepID=A0A1Q3CGQ6_CEPFO|nr:hypothetical protein CFOL_v3_22870 [Cephalotus follicularis]
MAVLAMCNISRPILLWIEEIHWMIDHSRGHTFPATVRKLAFAASVYHIWLERNRRSFKNQFLPVLEIIRKIRQDVAWKLLTGGKIQRRERHHSICINWGFFSGGRTIDHGYIVRCGAKVVMRWNGGVVFAAGSQEAPGHIFDALLYS